YRPGFVLSLCALGLPSADVSGADRAIFHQRALFHSGHGPWSAADRQTPAVAEIPAAALWAHRRDPVERPVERHAHPVDRAVAEVAVLDRHRPGPRWNADAGGARPDAG